MKFLHAFAQYTQRVFRAALSVIRHPEASVGWAFLNRTSLNYSAMVRADANSIVQACIRWAQRNFSEAPPILEQWNDARQDFDPIYRDDLLRILERPNQYYDGNSLFKAIIFDLMVGNGGGGDAYLLKGRSISGRVVELWWAPAHMMTPMGDPDDATIFLSHYDYRPTGGPATRIELDDVVHFQDGHDPDNPRRGFAPMKALFREIFTDDEAANMTASLLKNMGVPGLILAPEQGGLSVQVGEQIKTMITEKFTGDKKGEPLLLGAPMKVTQFGFSPEQMGMRSLRGIPEERITALLGINSAVLGLGAGLATTKVGATLREYREEATESFMVPLWKMIGQALTHQLLPDFRVQEGWQLTFDLSRVRVLREDEDKRAENMAKRLVAGGITVEEYRRALRMIVKPEHDVYLRSKNIIAVPAGLSPEEQAALSAAPMASQDDLPDANELIRRVEELLHL